MTGAENSLLFANSMMNMRRERSALLLY
jgi:hypothetical protein